MEQSKTETGNYCACKGIRTCHVCEEMGKQSVQPDQADVTIYTYCPVCRKAWERNEKHPDHQGNSVNFPGIYVQEEFITPAEEASLEKEIYGTPWVDSQSGRRKQDFGPKVNFKRKKVKSAVFTGLPAFSKPLYERMLGVDVLAGFIPVEQCHLEYIPERGSSIDPHFDDFWLWGERLVTINLISDTVLYFTCEEYPAIEVNVKMNRRSMLVVYGEARNRWKHGIHRSAIRERRLAVTLRELSAEFCEGGDRHEEGKSLLHIALSFKGNAVGSAIS